MIDRRRPAHGGPPRGRYLAVLAALVGCASCVMPDQVARLQKDVADVQQQLREVERLQAETREQIEKLDAANAADENRVGRSEMADVLLRIDDLSRQVEIADQRTTDLQDRLERLSQEVQQARELARRSSSGVVPGPPLEPPHVPPDADPAATPGTGVAGGASEATPDPESLYNTSYSDFSRGNYALAISGFEEYHERFPVSDLADNALYWIGECYFSQGDYAQAVRAFDRLLDRYPRSDRAAAANLKKALAFQEQNEIGKAIVQLRYVTTEYPDSDEARRAAERLASLGGSAN